MLSRSCAINVLVDSLRILESSCFRVTIASSEHFSFVKSLFYYNATNRGILMPQLIFIKNLVRPVSAVSSAGRNAADLSRAKLVALRRDLISYQSSFRNSSVILGNESFSPTMQHIKILVRLQSLCASRSPQCVSRDTLRPNEVRHSLDKSISTGA